MPAVFEEQGDILNKLPRSFLRNVTLTVHVYWSFERHICSHHM